MIQVASKHCMLLYCWKPRPRPLVLSYDLHSSARPAPLTQCPLGQKQKNHFERNKNPHRETADLYFDGTYREAAQAAAHARPPASVIHLRCHDIHSGVKRTFVMHMHASMENHASFSHIALSHSSRRPLLRAFITYPICGQSMNMCIIAAAKVVDVPPGLVFRELLDLLKDNFGIPMSP